jgi:phosphate transport system substrate-binding protein
MLKGSAMKPKIFGIFLESLIILTLVSVGCGPTDTSIKSGSDLQGKLTVSGAWALYPMMVRWSEEFQSIHPKVTFDISAGGAGKGMADALAGAVDIGMVSREIYAEEEGRGAFWVSVAIDAVFPTISADNPVWDDLNRIGISEETLVGIFITGEITTWGQVVGRPEVTDPIHIYTRSDACGAAATWADYLGGSQEDLLGIGVYGDPGLLDAVIKDRLSIGYNNLNYAFDMATDQPVTGAIVAPIDLNGNGLVDREEFYETKVMATDAVTTGRYPSPPARRLNLVTKGKPTALVKSFITWVLNEGQMYLDEAGYIALPGSSLEEELKKMDE